MLESVLLEVSGMFKGCVNYVPREPANIMSGGARSRSRGIQSV